MQPSNNKDVLNLRDRLKLGGSPLDDRGWGLVGDARDYAQRCRLTNHDIPELIRIAAEWVDDSVVSDDELDNLVPIAAWRGLAGLDAADAVEPLLDILNELVESDDDWMIEEFPIVFSCIGRPVVGSLLRFLREKSTGPSTAIDVAVTSLAKIALRHADERSRIVATLRELMGQSDRRSIECNSQILAGLFDLRASEAAEEIERAFAANHLDVGMVGGWEIVRKRLGVVGLGMKMPAQPYNSVESLRESMTTPEGTAAFMKVYNESLVRGDVSQPAIPAPPSAHQRNKLRKKRGKQLAQRNKKQNHRR